MMKKSLTNLIQSYIKIVIKECCVLTDRFKTKTLQAIFFLLYLLGLTLKQLKRFKFSSISGVFWIFYGGLKSL